MCELPLAVSFVVVHRPGQADGRSRYSILQIVRSINHGYIGSPGIFAKNVARSGVLNFSNKELCLSATLSTNAALSLCLLLDLQTTDSDTTRKTSGEWIG